jgi:hypothetical protein
MSPNTILNVHHDGFKVIIEVEGQEGIAVFSFTADDFIHMHYEGKHELLWTPYKPIKEGNASNE